MSTEFPIHRGVRQGDPLSPKLFTAVMEEVFKKTDISEGVNVDGENLTNLRFADDVALFNETTKQMEKHEWQPWRGKRSRGRPSRRWQDDMTEEGTTCIRKATDRRR